MFKKGNKVKWTSQSAGHTKTKEGIISEVVPAGSPPIGYKPNGGPAGCARNHESYVVTVGKRTYWPRVSQLSLVR